MTIPKHVVIGTKRYRVRVDADAIRPVEVEMSEKLQGNCDIRHQTIYLHPEQGDDQLVDTLVHECLHGIFDESALSQDFESDDEERLIRRLAPHVLALIRDNPKLVAAINEP